ncbi:MAG: bifunctional 4-hydroxy-2-oxoglutarate aldolase/2-dehydro-3-deoxy-phosphogluconate aldolase [Pseudomonadota bacterium]
MTELYNRLADAPVVPLVQANDPDVAVAITEALAAGGLTVIEVVLRTPAAMQCLAAIAKALPDVIVGAGTVLSSDQARQALDSGSKFIVSPGFDEGVHAVSSDAGVPLLPGVMTPTELQRASNLGLETVKFFPASIAGGVPALKALSSVFGHMKFMPTGGVSAANLAEYLSVPAVVACGGSWLTPADAIEAGHYEIITRLASEAVTVASVVRS